MSFTTHERKVLGTAEKMARSLSFQIMAALNRRDLTPAEVMDELGCIIEKAGHIDGMLKNLF